MKHKHITLMALAMSIVLSLSACGSAAETTDADTASVETTESVEETVESTESEAFVPEEELSTEETENLEAVPETTESVTETVEPVADSAAIEGKTLAGYTFTDVNKTMYAKTTVNVRSLPSTDGDKLGSLSKNQEVTVTGQCNETGWYRIKLNDSDAYVSNKYLSDEAVATAQASTGKTKTSNITAPTTVADGYNRAAAEQVWSLMNAERTAAGLNALTWDEDIYNFACQRAQALVTDYSHNGRLGYGENICYGDGSADANRIHQCWHDSPGHHDNYMTSYYVAGACAVYTYNGVVYAVENFTRTNAHDAYYGANQYREYNGETLDLSGAQAEAFDKGNIWIASNGIIMYIHSDGALSCNAIGDEANAAITEYYATH